MVNTTDAEQKPEAHLIDPIFLPRDQRVAFWNERIQTWKQSGLSQSLFCRQEKLVPHQFTYWLGKSQANSEKKESPSCGFIPVSVAASTPSQLQLTLPNGIILTGITDLNVDLVQRLIHSL